MTMFSLPNFCRVCLKYDKNLIDLAHIENEPSETLMSKLQLCVSEVEWTTFKPLLCHPCIKRLNIAYSFKKQCVQSAGVLKNYVELVKESQKKSESQNVAKSESPLPPGGAYMLLPNQKYVKIVVGSQNQGTTCNSFQNVFLNLIPTTTLNTVPNSTENATTPKSKDTNQNIFLNINNTFQKFIPITSVDPPPLKKSDVLLKPKEPVQGANVSVNQLLVESKAEEMSVEIDPTSFLSLEHDSSISSEDESKHDWDEVITKQKIEAKESKINGTTTVTCTTNGKGNVGSSFVPILPKEDFFSSGAHFLSSSFELGDITCEACQKSFSSLRILRQHMKQFHLGKFPFKCEYCYSEYLTRAGFEQCIRGHKMDCEALQNTSLTLKDFSENSSYESDALSISLISETPADHNLLPNENGDYVCDVCKRVFNSSTGLLRHKVRKHHQKNRKKYFIKGMKNAKCDICNREFSTQSYMQLHRKLHLRDDVGYKYKVLGKSKYRDIRNAEGEQNEQKSKEQNGDNEIKRISQNVEITPDISMVQDQEETDSCSENEMDHPSKKRRGEHGAISDLQATRDNNFQISLPESKSENNSISSNDLEIDQEQNQDDQESESSDEESHEIEDQEENE